MSSETVGIEQFVVVVSGLPRSGTSMMMQLLAAGGIPVLTDELRKADEDNPRGYYELEQVKQVRDDASWLDEAGGKAVKMVYRLLYDLPSNHQYRVIFLRRTLGEVVDSQEEMLLRLGKPAGDIPRERLVQIYADQLDKVYDWLRDQPNFQVIYVDYADVLADTDRVVRQIDEFLGGGLDTAAMRQVPDRRLHRQRH